MNNWITLDRYKGLYEFCNDGRIKCLPKIKNGNREIITSGSVCSGKKKYYVIYLTNKNGIRRQEKVHRIIGEAFVPNPLNLPIINHLDNNGLNNNHWNLEWTTDLGNKEHAKEIGVMPSGENQFLSKLTNEQVKEISKSKLSQGKLAKIYGVSQSTIGSIKRGRTWNKITGIFSVEKNKRLCKRDILNIFNSEDKFEDISGSFGVSLSIVEGIKNKTIHKRVTEPKIFKTNPSKETILNIFSEKGKVKEIAKKYNVSRAYVSGIRNGRLHEKITGSVYKDKRLPKSIILAVFNLDLPYKEISSKFNISRKNISAIKTGYRHSNVTGKIFIKTK